MKKILDWRMDDAFLEANSRYFLERLYMIICKEGVWYEASYHVDGNQRVSFRGSLYECLDFCENEEEKSHARKLENRRKKADNDMHTGYLG